MKFTFRNKHKSNPSSTASTSTATFTPASTPTRTPLPPGDTPASLLPGQKVTPLDIRDLNELIRTRYALDVEIWGKRNCRPRDRPLLLEKMARSDAALSKILGLVEAWDREDVWETRGDWQRLRMIRERLERGDEKRVWMGNPPWEDERERAVSVAESSEYWSPDSVYSR